MNTLDEVREAIREATGSAPDGPATPVGGGCINEAFRLGDYFVKTNHPEREDLFTAEEDGLRAIGKTDVVQVPGTVCSGVTANHAYLVLEHLPLGRLSPVSEARLGRQMARLHRVGGDSFGWHRDNYIGSTPQRNTRSASWPEFFRDHRLAPLLDQLAASGTRFRDAPRLLEAVPAFFPQTLPVPSLLHGDLWGGNAAALPDGTPVIFDPAVYLGDRETDLAMTRLFGGFGPAFHEAYQDTWPLPDGAELRITLYNLYHILNHALLFGGGYAGQAEGMIGQLCAELG